MRIAIGSDHRGFDVKLDVARRLQSLGHEVADVGTSDTESVDYPDYAVAVGTMVSQGQAERGILICGTGIGMSIAANKVRGVRAVVCHDRASAELSRRHNDANVLCLAADSFDEPQIDSMMETWLSTEFDEGRHLRRVEKIEQIEQRSGAE